MRAPGPHRLSHPQAEHTAQADHPEGKEGLMAQKEHLPDRSTRHGVHALRSRGDIGMRKLTGTVAVVTGASTGSGAALAKGRAAAGAAVAMNYASDTEGAGRTVSEMTSHGGKAIVLQAEVARAADVQRMCEATTHVFGAVDTNVLAPILAIQEALQHFPASGGSIITISSSASENPAGWSWARRKCRRVTNGGREPWRSHTSAAPKEWS